MDHQKEFINGAICDCFSKKVYVKIKRKIHLQIKQFGMLYFVFPTLTVDNQYILVGLLKGRVTFSTSSQSILYVLNIFLTAVRKAKFIRHFSGRTTANIFFLELKKLVKAHATFSNTLPVPASYQIGIKYTKNYKLPDTDSWLSPTFFFNLTKLRKKNILITDQPRDHTKFYCYLATIQTGCSVNKITKKKLSSRIYLCL
jgi:hypothetical protein